LSWQYQKFEKAILSYCCPPPQKKKKEKKVLKSNLTPQSKIWVLVTKPSLLTRPKKNSWILVAGSGVG
jgi:hypothetical protein